jgi:hypothetical protein
LGWWKQILVQFFLGLGTLVAGLVLTGHDGKMWTYTALVLVAGTCQWALSRGWRR